MEFLITEEDCLQAEADALRELKKMFGGINSIRLAQAVADTRAYYHALRISIKEK